MTTPELMSLNQSKTSGGRRNDNVMKIINDASKYVTFTTALLGLVGSLMIILIMTKKPFSSMPRSIFCVALAIIDILYLIYQLMFASCRIWFDTYPGLVSRYSCKFIYCFIWMAIQLDAWLIVCLSGERVLAIFWPLEVKGLVTKKRVKIVLPIIFGILMLWNIEALYRYDHVIIGSYKQCTGVNTWLFSARAFYIKDRITESLKTFIPVPLVALCNIAIFIKLYQIRKHRSELGASSTDNSESQRINVMIISMTVLFVVLLAPSSIYASIYGLDTYNDPINSVLFQLTLLNPSANFYVYFISGSLFRAEVLKWFREKVSQKVCQRSTLGPGHETQKDRGQGQGQSDIPGTGSTVMSETSVVVSVVT